MEKHDYSIITPSFEDRLTSIGKIGTNNKTSVTSQICAVCACACACACACVCGPGNVCTCYAPDNTEDPNDIFIK